MISDDLATVPFALIMINDTVEVGKTDLDVFFQIDMPVSVNNVLFRYIGMEPAQIVLVDNCNEVEIIMMLSGTYDFMTLKKVDRLRMKRFKKLPELHKEAFAKGIFKTDRACYTQTFIPYVKRNDNAATN